MCVEQTRSGTDFSLCISVFAYQYHSTNVPSFIYMLFLAGQMMGKMPAFW
jgi:hypothetical protein